MIKFEGEQGIKIKQLIDCIKVYCSVNEKDAKRLFVEAITQKDTIKTIEQHVLKAVNNANSK